MVGFLNCWRRGLLELSVADLDHIPLRQHRCASQILIVVGLLCFTSQSMPHNFKPNLRVVEIKEDLVLNSPQLQSYSCLQACYLFSAFLLSLVLRLNPKIFLFKLGATTNTSHLAKVHPDEKASKYHQRSHLIHTHLIRPRPPDEAAWKTTPITRRNNIGDMRTQLCTSKSLRFWIGWVRDILRHHM